MTSPASRTVLIAVTGLSPAVVTETVWALATQPGQKAIPDRIVVITTRSGATRLRETLLAPGEWTAFTSALQRHLGGPGPSLVGKLRFGPAQDHLRIIPSAQTRGGPVEDADDIRTPADHDAAADFIMRTVREYSEEEDNRLIFSVAGGRKTMGALLFSVASLLGRPGDRVTHVLVNEPYENPSYGFLYPGKLLGPDLLPAGTRPPKIELADVPFVPLRRLFARDLGGRISGYMDLVRRLNDKVADLAAVSSLTLDINAQTLTVNDGAPLKIGPRAFCLMLAYAHLAHSHTRATIPLKNIADTVRKLPRHYPPRDPSVAWVETARQRLDDAHKSLSDLRSDLSRKLALTPAQVDRVVPHRKRTCIDLAPEAITIR